MQYLPGGGELWPRKYLHRPRTGGGITNDQHNFTPNEPSPREQPEQSPEEHAEISRRDFLQLGAASTAGLALAGATAREAAAQPGGVRVQPGLRPQLDRLRPVAGAVRVADVTAAQAALLDAPTLIPTTGRLARGGTLSAVAGNPERPRRNADRRDPTGDKNPNYNRDGTPKTHGGRKPIYKVNLLCRTFDGDAGFRPLAPDLVFWESPDIWVEGPTGDPDQAQAGASNRVHVHVWNLGRSACHAAFVDLYWCNPSVGVSAAEAHPIGSQTVALMGGEHKIVTFAWTPTLENGGHECLVAQVYDPISDPLVAPFGCRLDRHVAQRNVSVVSATPGKSVLLSFFAPNLSAVAAGSTLEVERVGGRALQLMARNLGRATLRAAPAGAAGLSAPLAQAARPVLNLERVPGGAIFREPLRGARSVQETRALSGALRTLSAPGRKRLLPLAPLNSVNPGGAQPRLNRRELLRDPGALLGVRRGELATKRELRIEPNTELRLALSATMPRAAPSGAVEVLRVVERVGGQITGGVTLIVEAP